MKWEMCGRFLLIRSIVYRSRPYKTNKKTQSIIHIHKVGWLATMSRVDFQFFSISYGFVLPHRPTPAKIDSYASYDWRLFITIYHSSQAELVATTKSRHIWSVDWNPVKQHRARWCVSDTHWPNKYFDVTYHMHRSGWRSRIVACGPAIEKKVLTDFA